MRRLFAGNFDFENELADASRVGRGDPLSRIVAELAPIWAAIASDGDFVWHPTPIDPEFSDQLQRQGLPRVKAVSHVSEIPTGLELVPWGWTARVIAWGRSVGAVIDAPPLDAVRTVNSRRFSHQREQERGIGLDGSAMAETPHELLAAIESLPRPETGWVVKAEFSNASRERFLHRGESPPDRDALLRWAERRLRTGQALFVEPWVDRVDEVGVQLTIPKHGEPRLEGVTRLMVDDAGRYRGSEFTPAVDDEAAWRDAVAAALDAAVAAQQAGYFGPLGIDAMRYRDAAGAVRLRPLQDVNARWTMGRLSLGLRRLLRPGERGCWLHGPPPHSLREREISMSPSTLDGRPVRLRTTVVITNTS